MGKSVACAVELRNDDSVGFLFDVLMTSEGGEILCVEGSLQEKSGKLILDIIECYANASYFFPMHE